MWEFILFIRDGIASITGMLDSFSFNLGSMTVSLFELFIGFIAMGLIIAVFWKGSRV